MAYAVPDRSAILRIVRGWSKDEQIAFARDILQLAQGNLTEEPLSAPDSQSLAGLFATDAPPPTDDEVARWLNEHRMEKYGD